MAMQMAQLMWNQNKMLLSVRIVLQLRVGKGTLAANITTKTSAVRGEELNVNSYGNNNSSVGIDSIGDVRKLGMQSRLEKAHDIRHAMDQRCVRPHSSIYASLLQECISKKALPEGKQVHAHMIGTGFNSDVFLKTKLVIMYAMCGSLVDARRVLDEMPTRNVVSWTAMIAAYARNGYGEEALKLFYQMQRTGIQPDQFTFAGVLPACANLAALKHGKKVHEGIIRGGFQFNVFVESALVDMYVKCGSIKDARQVFDKMSEQNVVLWTKMIGGYAQNGQVGEALELFQKMPERDLVSWNVIIAGYAQNGYCDEALKFFEKSPERNLITWNTMVAGYAQNGDFNEALNFFRQMQLTGMKPNPVTLACVLPACANLAALKHGKEIHKDIIRNGFQFDIFVGNALVDMYSKCGSIKDARHVFDKMPKRDMVSWTAIIAGYAHNRQLDEALKLFLKMPEQEIVSWNVMIAGYAQNGYVDEAVKLFNKMPEKDVVSWNAMIAGYAQHGYVNEAWTLFHRMTERDLVSWNTMIAGCAQAGRVDKAMELFQKIPEQNVVSWNALITGYVHNGHYNESLKLFRQMQPTEVKPNLVTFTSVLSACANMAAVELGREIHEDIIKSGFPSDIVLGNALVDMYAKGGSLEDARNMFNKMLERDVVSWTAMIGGYAQNDRIDEALIFFQKMPGRNIVSWNTMIVGYVQKGDFIEALKLFKQMQLTGVKPDSATFADVLPVCANLAALEYGKGVHGDIIRSGFLSDVFVGNALVDMYAKCGSIDDAGRVFDKMLQRSAVSWNAMIVGYGMHGCGKEALQLFDQMQHSGMEPDHVTFIGVLSACCHAGLVDDGWHYFDCMSRDYHITPTVEHYCCMVDLLGRAGSLDEALDFINNMPIKPDVAVWGSLLGACRIHNNLELGEHVAKCLFDLDLKNAANYVLLSNIYAATGRWDDVEKVRILMKDRRIKKSPGCSWIEVNNKLYAFPAGEMQLD